MQWEGSNGTSNGPTGPPDCSLHVQRRKDSWTLDTGQWPVHIAWILKIEEISNSTQQFHAMTNSTLSGWWSKRKQNEKRWIFYNFVHCHRTKLFVPINWVNAKVLMVFYLFSQAFWCFFTHALVFCLGWGRRISGCYVDLSILRLAQLEYERFVFLTLEGNWPIILA